jgi:hypothetical protein
MSTGFCPNCREPRVGMFRYCRKCGFDYDDNAVVPPTAPAGAQAPVPPAAPTLLDPTIRPYDANQNMARGAIAVQNFGCRLLIGGGIGLVLSVILMVLIAPALENANPLVDLFVLVAFPVIGFAVGIRVTAQLLAR